MFDIYWMCYMSEGKDHLVREERWPDATGRWVVRQGTPSSYATKADSGAEALVIGSAGSPNPPSITIRALRRANPS